MTMTARGLHRSIESSMERIVVDGEVRSPRYGQYGTSPMTSNSVPSTPRQQPRDLSMRTRTPSPSSEADFHSPRSVSSEANSSLLTLRRPRKPCKFESTAALGRRRIAYNIGSDPLERPRDPPRRAPSGAEDDSLTQRLLSLYQKLLPSPESEARRTKMVVSLETILKNRWPEEHFRVHVFGSSGNMLCSSDSDGM